VLALSQLWLPAAAGLKVLRLLLLLDAAIWGLLATDATIMWSSERQRAARTAAKRLPNARDGTVQREAKVPLQLILESELGTLSSPALV